MGSVPGVILGAVLLALLQSWWLADLTEWIRAAGRLIDVAWLQRVDLVPAIELIFGIILVVAMLFRREGLIPARHRAATSSLTPAVGLQPFDLTPPPMPIRPGELLEVRNLTVRF